MAATEGSISPDEILAFMKSHYILYAKSCSPIRNSLSIIHFINQCKCKHSQGEVDREHPAHQ